MEIELDNQLRLGRGDFGSVFSGTFQGRKVAIRRIELIDASDNEVEALKQLDHPNIIKLFRVERNNDFKFIALELCEASLDKIFLEPNHPKKYKGPKLPYHFEAFSQLASGLEYIHSKKLIHGDIKPEHVLISVDSTSQDIKVTVKWAGFGLSRTVDERGMYTMDSGGKGTRHWYAPELLLKLLLGSSDTMQQITGTVQSDVFALGLVFAYLLLDGQHIYGCNEIEIINNILGGKKVNMNKIEQSHYAYGLVTEMLKNKPEDRISSLNIFERLKAIRVEITGKEMEMFTLCKMRETETVFSLIFPWIHPNEKIKNLVLQGVDVNAKDGEGNNALHLLCRYNSSERLSDAIKLLIQLGSDVNEKVKDGDNALHLLCRYNSSARLSDAIKLLIQLGIDVNEKNHNGINALHFLCANNSNERVLDAMTLLIQLGIDVNEKNNNRDNALHMLCYNNSSDRLIDAIKLLIPQITDVNEKDKNGSNALHLLCFNNSSGKLIKAINLLIQKKIDVKEKTNYGSNALHLLCRNNTSKRLIETIKLLIDHHGIEVHEKVKDGDNALHLLCRYNSSERLMEAIELLIQLGIDVNGKNKDGDNALHLLCRFNLSERLRDAIELLIELGIDVNVKNKKGENALYYLHRHNSSERIVNAIKLLEIHVNDSNDQSFLQ